MTRFFRGFVTATLAVTSLSGTAHARQQAPAVTGPFTMRMMDSTYDSGSPDGKLVVYHKGKVAGKLYVRDLSGGAERVLVDSDGTVGDCAWSPDSRRLAFTFTAKAPRSKPEVRIVTIATGATRALGAAGTVRAWTATDEILFSDLSGGRWGNGIYLVAAGGGRPRMVLQQYTNAAITPDGRALVVAVAGRLIRHDLTTESERTVTATIAYEAMPIISPDGRLLAFASDRDGAWALYVAPFDSRPVRNPVRIASLDDEPYGQVAWWTRSGSLVVRPTYGGTYVHRINMDPVSGHTSGSPQRLKQEVSYNEYPFVSPDNQLVAYQWYRGESQGIGTIGAGGGGTRVVLERSTGVPEPVGWRSPEEILVYDSGAEPHGFATLNVRTKALVPMRARELVRQQFAYVPRRQEVLFSIGMPSAKAVELKALSLSDGNERVVATIDYLISYCASPDGQHVAYARWTAGPRSPGEIRLMTIDGKPEDLLFSGPAAASAIASWSPDGRFLLYFDADDAPRVMNVQTHESWPLIDGDDQPDFWSYEEANWSPDGSFIVITGDATWKDAQLRVWEGVTYDAVVRIMKARGGD